MSMSRNNAVVPYRSREKMILGIGQYAIAEKMFFPAGKKPLSYQNKKIKDLYDLRLFIDRFQENEAARVADWLDYLGDGGTAVRINNEPMKLKVIVLERYDQLADIYCNGLARTYLE